MWASEGRAALALALLVSGAAMADQLQGRCGDLSARVTESGIAALEVEGYSAPGAGTLSHSVRAKSFRYLERSDRIPLRVGVVMGMDYEVSGIPSGRTVTLLHVKRYPLMTAPDGRTSTQSSGTINLGSEGGSARGRQYWVFEQEYPFELVAGTWTFQVFYENCLLVEKTYTTYRP